MISRAVASLADAALLLPASALVVLILLGRRQWLLAAGWAAGIGATGVVTILFKLLFRACGPALTSLDVVSPSGHTALATIFYGALAVLLSAGRPPAIGRLLGSAVAVFVVAVCVSRVRTEAHTIPETLIGVGIGACALMVVGAVQARAGRPRLPILPFAAGFAVLLVLLGGLHFSLEGRLAQMARRLSALLNLCGAPEQPGAIGFLTGRR